MNMKENPEGIHRQFKKYSVLTNTESHYSGSSERLIIPITEEDKKRDREQIMKYIEDRKLMRKDYTEALNEYGGNNPYDR